MCRQLINYLFSVAQQDATILYLLHTLIPASNIGRRKKSDSSGVHPTLKLQPCERRETFLHHVAV